ncbi:N-acetyltransferase [Sphingobacterium sp. SRCM116780]|uniref:N-acetyltransferase n=1 Tax=Sphingobacterium sp. SRCM116780 TaxID=2907623 RepID=UPI001F33BC80|nr:N-acetyltransferase [Sphingobacterium sp. SRCM116780]UIR57384.1 N-acetyltransferase [Sphingobacterium sp. SRCM116780]
MNHTNIREAQQEDIDQLVNIWYEASIVAHDFIPESYWKENKQLMSDHYLPASEVYVATDGQIRVGFIALVEDDIAAIFVLPAYQGQGKGSLLLNHAKKLRDRLLLKVYKKNLSSVGFYQAQGFTIIDESIDEQTGENEYVMEWKTKK